jgi:hypothetical protein
MSFFTGFSFCAVLLAESIRLGTCGPFVPNQGSATREDTALSTGIILKPR